MIIGSKAALSLYLAGSWDLSKRLEYRRGGAFGQWIGRANFRPTKHDQLQLMYTEEGRMFFDSSTTITGFESAGRPLCYDFRDGDNDNDSDSEASPYCGKVYFVEPYCAGENTPCLRYFHSLPMTSICKSSDIDLDIQVGSSCSFDHMCVKDLYTGTLRIDGTDSFSIVWHVFGPTKDGDTTQIYKRCNS